MNFMFILLLLIVLIAILIEHTKGNQTPCPQSDFLRKHTCANCDVHQAKEKAESTNKSRKKKKYRVKIETVFIVDAHGPWREHDDLCKTDSLITCYDFRKNGKGKFTQYRKGHGHANHNKEHGHYEHKTTGACFEKGKWISI